MISKIPNFRATYRSELSSKVLLDTCESEHERKLIIRTRDFSRHSKTSITTVSVYDLFLLSFFSTMMKKCSSMLLLLAISSLSSTSMHGRVHKTASVYFVCKLSKAYFTLHVVCSKQGEIRSSIAVTGDLVFQKRYFHHCLLKDCSESC